MNRSHPCLRLDVIITPAADITRLRSTFRPVNRAFLRFIIGDLPLLADFPVDWTLLRTSISFWDTQQVSRLAILLGLRDEEILRELRYGWEHSVRITWLVDFIHVRALCSTGESYQCDACHGFLLLIFGTILFPYSSNLIDGALAQVMLQMVGGHSYVEAILAETIRSLDYVREGARSSFQVESSDNSAAYRIFPQRRIALHTGSCGQTQQLHFRTSFYELGKFDAYGACVTFSSFTSRNIPLTTSELSPLLQHMWLSSIHRDLHLFVDFARHGFHGHRTQTFQRQRAPPKEP
ncbi:hypothetical protein CRG98_017847 [Punica granatum]|uniref:Aminotransferase-like plant mobile domain-containing protein n=1 Tax=Punica granatum TaxID=22663 RepID=A0A2I0JZJ5_PUNGR|nr:hypothetical protein CRG98_017847 [Punica granatum]